MARAKQRTPELRDHLLDVAIATLADEGIAGFTTRRVAERAGTSVPAVYELFDDKAGLVWARLMAEGKAAGRPRSGLDMIIATVAGSNDCVVVTDNERDFVGLQIVNPMRGDL